LLGLFYAAGIAELPEDAQCGIGNETGIAHRLSVSRVAMIIVMRAGYKDTRVFRNVLQLRFIAATRSVL
jgi:hypothetical protein